MYKSVKQLMKTNNLPPHFYVCATINFLKDVSLVFFSCCCLVTKSCPILWDPMDYSSPGFPVLHYLLCVCVVVAQSCLSPCNPMDCSLPGFSVRGIFQARILQWVAISFSRGSSWPRDQTQASSIADRLFTIWATREAS